MNKEEEIVESKKRKRKEVAIYGNYRSYYGYRISKDMEEDPRFTVFKKEWFEGKDCLDIGCNQGLITINIAKKFCCRSIVGVDIDGNLIENAHSNLKRISKESGSASQSPKASETEQSDKANGFVEQSSSVHETVISASNGSVHETAISANNLSDRVSFRQENFVGRLCGHSEIYDTILCLSVSKWVHLNWGDDGLITLFANIWRLLRPGGILLLEPQPWKSYISNHLISETVRWHYHNITLGPADFQEVLLDKIGFKNVEHVNKKKPGKVAGFNRPIFIFRK